MLEVELQLLFFFILPASIIGIVFFGSRYYKNRSLRNKLRKSESEIEQAYNELLIIWNRDRYLEHRTITRWLKDWSYLEQLVSESLNNKLLSSELKGKIARLFSVFNVTPQCIYLWTKNLMKPYKSGN